MADLDDTAARKAIVTALGTTCGVVRGDPATTDALAAQVRLEERNHLLRFLVCAQTGSAADEVDAYAQAIGDLLGAQISHFHTPAVTGINLNALVERVEHAGYDLILFGEPDRPLMRRLLLGPVDRRVAERVPASLLLVRQPRWPLRRILLIIRGEKMDGLAVEWIVRLARPSSAVVTVLAVVPPMPALYHGLACMEQGLSPLLAGNSTLGRQMRRAAHRLTDSEINNALRLYQRPLDLLIRREVAEREYDLIALACERHPRWLRWLLGELVGPLLRWANRPVLIAKLATGTSLLPLALGGPSDWTGAKTVAA